MWLLLPILAHSPALAGGFAADPKIINGDGAALDVYPESGAMIVDLGGMLMVMCSSTHIAPDVVMLAAHCIDPSVIGGEPSAIGWSRQSDLTAYIDGSAADWPDDVTMAADWVMNPSWNYANLQVGLADNEDIALLFLEEARSDIPHAWLPTEAESQQIVEGKAVDIVGWGMTDAVDTFSFGTKNWGASTIDAVSDWEFQVGEATEAVRHCHGDSGGPTFMQFETEATIAYRVVGVTSHAWDSTDCTETGGVATRVDYYLEWVDEEMRSRCADGSRPWCDFPGIIPPPIPGSAKELKGDVDLVGCSSTGSRDGVGLAVLALAGMLAGARRR